jgi:hypothetical protein
VDASHERTVANALLPRGDTALPEEIPQSTQEPCGLSIEQLSSTFIGSANEQSLQYLISTFKEVLNIGIGFKMQRQVKLARTSIPETKSFDDIPETGINLEQFYRNFEGIASESSNMGFPDSGNAVPALAASILIPLLNQNMVRIFVIHSGDNVVQIMQDGSKYLVITRSLICFEEIG